MHELAIGLHRKNRWLMQWLRNEMMVGRTGNYACQQHFQPSLVNIAIGILLSDEEHVSWVRP